MPVALVKLHTMSPSSPNHVDDTPPGWTTEAKSDDIHSWVGPAERLLCSREGNDTWVTYSQPRSELGAPTQVQLTDGPVELDQALSVAFEYMERNSDTE
ncbi:hypothetical protein [Haladaptatus caseinilyticus]|uniref:hypothetical protein n=1 Tax=Haladaptatus caseinilyticus TaxID=2993314 RepID=UPI00224B48B4|nr:hypothetical protein [Haladaptatus caseinilyticus]